MRPAALGLAFLAAAVFAPAVRADSPETAWEKFGEDDGIAVFRRDIPGSPIIALRGEGVVNAPILRVASVLIDTKRAPEWIDSLSETKTLRKVSDVEYVEWDHVTTPFILKDRDFVFDTKLELSKENKQIALNYHSVTDPGAPKTDYVRGEFIYGKFVLTSIEDGKKTRVLAELLCDPKGSVAKWLVNMFQKDWPHKTLESLRAQVKKSNILDDARLKDALEKAGI
jgi:hypothetical protein